MRRVWVCSLIVILGTGLGACTGKGPSPITRSLNLNDGGSNPEGEKLAKASGEGSQCLDIDAVTRELAQYGDLVTVYTNDIDLGQITSGQDDGESCMRFEGVADADLDRAAVALTKDNQKPILETWPAKDLMKLSSMGALIATSTPAEDEKCKYVTINGGAGVPADKYQVICHQPNAITIRASQVNGNFMISYFLKKDSLVVISYQSATVTCPQSASNSYTIKRSYTITWGNLPSLSLRRRFASLIQKYLANPSGELNAAVTVSNAPDKSGKRPVVGDDVKLSPLAVNYIFDQVAKENFTDKLTCKAN
jgi:hypothetical protein